MVILGLLILILGIGTYKYNSIIMNVSLYKNVNLMCIS